ncbi:unnamed protein product [Prorocentrum cordatum]|uniref:Uncharacterized protein n=1 Tax=Prorocentrum cordatum TaxID=2364126 RepID=A0ABN9R4Z1_9DINO|nr:unnamed protein product [Polarella glacialis]|mmetsp:Transcript_17109/g.47642  ORF Transcript_17109/g.47642 Transcript_17109/m.47642 type:complete len:177 (+) Transcript_17109:37-567(+)
MPFIGELARKLRNIDLAYKVSRHFNAQYLDDTMRLLRQELQAFGTKEQLKQQVFFDKDALFSPMQPFRDQLQSLASRVDDWEARLPLPNSSDSYDPGLSHAFPENGDPVPKKQITVEVSFARAAHRQENIDLQLEVSMEEIAEKTNTINQGYEHCIGEVQSDAGWLCLGTVALSWV